MGMRVHRLWLRGCKCKRDKRKSSQQAENDQHVAEATYKEREHGDALDGGGLARRLPADHDDARQAQATE
jgi:hypothetical protein